MSEQGSEAANPGQAIYDALSDEAKAAVDSLPSDLLEGENGPSLAQFMASSAYHINSRNPALWSIQRTVGSNGGEFLVLNVAGANAILVGRNEVRVLADSAISDQLDLGEIHASWLPISLQGVQPVQGSSTGRRSPGHLDAIDRSPAGTR